MKSVMSDLYVEIVYILYMLFCSCCWSVSVYYPRLDKQLEPMAKDLMGGYEGYEKQMRHMFEW